MKAALARHDTLLREAIEARTGYIFKTVGDAFYAAFAEPSDALAAAKAAQQILLKETWPPELGDLRVRMALHTGVAEEREGDYFGPPLNRVSRLLAAGHGSQILLSLATQELVRDALPDGVTLLDLGDHRLKDLFRPERIFQVKAPGLPFDFPALRTIDARLTNLPAQSTLFIGREREIAATTALLRRDDVRLVTLTGPGGTGKTRLGLQVAADLLDDYEHGVWLINLAPVTDPAMVATAIGAALGMRTSGEEPMVETLTRHLASRAVLLVIDNFEQVVEAAPVVSTLLAAAARLKVLVTSREILQISGEHQYSIPPLSVPDLNRKETVAVISQYEAVSLFILRAQAVQPDFAIDEESAPPIAEICVRLDGLPLAIELAASRINLFSADQLLARLGDRLKTVSGGMRDLPARQRTLRNTIDWSYDLLDYDEKAVFACLAVFQGGRTLEMAEKVISEKVKIDVADGIQSLVHKSLLRQVTGESGQPRFVMLDTIYEYAREKLMARPDVEKIRESHAEVFSELTSRLKSDLLGGSSVEKWVTIYADEQNNVLEALDWTLSGNAVAQGAQMLDDLNNFWFPQGYIELLDRWSDRALRFEDSLEPMARVGLLEAGGLANFSMNRVVKARELFGRAVSILRGLDEPTRLALLLARSAGTTMGDKSLYEQARKWLDEALALARKHESAREEARALLILAEVTRTVGGFTQAIEANQQALKIAQASNFEVIEAMSQANMGNIYAIQGDYATGLEHARRALRCAQAANYTWMTGEGLWNIGRSLAGTGKSRAAARLYGAAEKLRESVGGRVQRGDLPDYESGRAMLKAALTAADLDRLWAEGRAMTTEEAVDYALKETPDDKSATLAGKESTSWNNKARSG